MSIEITTAQTSQFNSNLDMLSQQKDSRLSGCVRVESVVGKEEYFDQIGATAAVKRTSRHAATPRVDTPHARRRVAPFDYDWSDWIDNMDEAKMLIAPQGKYTLNALAAFNRAKDDEIIEAAHGTAYTGEDGTTQVAFPTSSNTVVHGSAGLTIAKILAAKEIILASDVDPDLPRYFALPEKSVNVLLQVTEVKSADYNTIKALAQGKIDTFAGFKFIQTERLLKSSTTRSCIAWAEPGLLLGIGVDTVVSVDKLPTHNQATQVYVGMSVGATRMEEAMVAEVQVTE